MRSASLVITSSGDEQVVALNSFRHSAVILSRSPERSEGREATKDLSSVRIELGDLTSAQELDVVLRMDFPLGAPGETASVVMKLHSAGQPVVGGSAEGIWPYAWEEENDAQPRNVVVDPWHGANVLAEEEHCELGLQITGRGL